MMVLIKDVADVMSGVAIENPCTILVLAELFIQKRKKDLQRLAINP